MLDLFWGAGGMSLGFEQAGFDAAVGIDGDPQACRTHALNFPDATTVCGDLRDPDVRAALPRRVRGGRWAALPGLCSQVRNHE